MAFTKLQRWNIQPEDERKLVWDEVDGVHYGYVEYPKKDITLNLKGKSTNQAFEIVSVGSKVVLKVNISEKAGIYPIDDVDAGKAVATKMMEEVDLLVPATV